MEGFGLPITTLGGAAWEQVAELTESGTQWLAGMLQPHETGRETLPQVSSLAARLTEPWQALGMPASSLDSFLLTTFCGTDRERPGAPGTAGLDEASTLRTLSRVLGTAEALTEQINS